MRYCHKNIYLVKLFQYSKLHSSTFDLETTTTKQLINFIFTEGQSKRDDFSLKIAIMQQKSEKTILKKKKTFKNHCFLLNYFLDYKFSKKYGKIQTFLSQSKSRIFEFFLYFCEKYPFCDISLTLMKYKNVTLMSQLNARPSLEWLHSLRQCPQIYIKKDLLKQKLQNNTKT